jgi:hypothetical protein
MFDSIAELPAVRTADLAGLIEQNHAELLSAECRMLQLACAWADAPWVPIMRWSGARRAAR